VRVVVLGGGAWGTALALQAERAGHQVTLWARDREQVRRMRETRVNARHLPGHSLPAPIEVTAGLQPAVVAAEVVIVAVPSEFCRRVYAELQGRLPEAARLLSATKGIEPDSLARMSEVAAAELGGREVAILSGPSFAHEVAAGLPTAVVIAAREVRLAEDLQHALASSAFRVYSSDDVVGVELAGALKNVIAIAAGVVDGLGLGHNTVAALITRGLAEMARLSEALGGRPDTLSGLAGLGDLVLTCTGSLSRNRSLGQQLGRGRSLEEAQRAIGAVAEGVRTTRAAVALAGRAGIEMPIATAMHQVLYEGRAPSEAVEELMLRALKRE
jgi:glycerol-3-phosphate dehydrogenase (NAD(P)+)